LLKFRPYRRFDTFLIFISALLSLRWTFSYKYIYVRVYFLSQYSVWLRTGQLGDRGSIPGGGKEDFSSSLCVQTGSEAHPASCTMGTGGPFPGAKARPGRDADHSPHLVPKSWLSRSYASSLPCALKVCCGTALSLHASVICSLYNCSEFFVSFIRRYSDVLLHLSFQTCETVSPY
jgi:hypothetical protein